MIHIRSAFFALLGLSISHFTSATPASSSASAPVVDLGYAQYQGSLDSATNVTTFTGIRYAAPPLGELRFAAPQPPTAQTGVQDATGIPAMCYQGPYGNNETAPVSVYGFNKRATAVQATSEDCLFLNVFIPGEMPAEAVTGGGLPVVFWIHGGGYDSGSAAAYNGTDLIMEAEGGVIVVVTQYRLGAFGFLAGNEVKAGGATNVGILDQRYALEWVQKNIATFGGDASKVTIWGQSAGAGSVLQHLVANGGNTQPPLFNAAITSSTFLPSQYNYNDRIPQLIYDEVVAQTGCSSSADTLACLRTVNATAIETVNEYIAASAFYGSYVWVPVVDGTLITERPSVTMASGQVNGEYYLAVGNTFEGPDFVNQNETLTVTDYVSQLFPDLPLEQVEEAAYIYSGLGTPVDQANYIMGESIFVCPTYFMLAPFAGRSWKGIFAIPPGLHGDDVAYYFDDVAPPYNNTQFRTAFDDIFMAFAMHNNPNAKYDPTDITPYWNEYYIGQSEMLFNETVAGVPEVVPVTTDQGLLDRCAFWAGVTAMTAQ
ncbi:Alpha/Beta hydrolase protein [Hygrophoropsis aurantiaca]|uniref:Alpha/Beta hydrolase protein n=1 Tax=Hygrophoropsis aurantiaca TaxID=72124 RepID=A0ACB8A241_9AGAM|nr:Alpha/Beta hydrolase protein [Hygrophoropsis aurantiaca]